MLHDDGLLTICTLENQNGASSARMPNERLVPGPQHYFGERTVGYGRQYAAMGVNQQVDMLVEIWQDRSIHIGMYAMIEGEQYRIDNVQHLKNDDALGVTYLTLRRLEDLYDVSGEG